MNKPEQPIFTDVTVNLDKLPGTGRSLEVVTNATQLDELASRLKVSAVGRFDARIVVVGVKGGVRVTGQMTAEVTQPCVVSLSPVHQNIKESLDRVFMPLSAELHQNESEESSVSNETVFGSDEDDIPDYYKGSELNLSEFLLESLGLAVDLYPRAAGAKLDPDQAGDDVRELSPFAILKSLNKKV